MRVWWLSACGALALSGCGSDSGGSGTSRIRVTTPSGDPIAGATVWIEGANTVRQGLSLEPGACAPAPASASVSACCDAAGEAELSCDGVATVHYQKGSFSGSVDIDCGSDEVQDISLSPNSGASLAVVTGQYDRIQDVLGKLGFASVDSTGHLELGSEVFTLYDGDASLPGDYRRFADVLLEPETLATHDIIFVNCDEFGLGDELAGPDEAEKIANLRDYVASGGKLYATDLSYDYVEQIVPDAFDFFGPGATTPGAAESGVDGSDDNANLEDEGLVAWLANVTVNDGDIGFCIDVTERTGGLNADGTVAIGGLLGGWAKLEGTVQAPAKAWVAGTDLEGSARLPLTVTSDVGTEGGRVLFTSYHTAELCPTRGFWPQERILQYLVFEL